MAEYRESFQRDLMGGGRKIRTGTDVMQVCENGHQITASLKANPDDGKAFCPECGSKTVSECGACSHPLRGYKWGGVALYSPPVPKFCEKCGTPFPWTAARLTAFDEMVGELDNLNADERAHLKVSIRDLVVAGPRTELGASRFKKLAKKGGQTVGSALYTIAIDVISEAGKKALLGS